MHLQSWDPYYFSPFGVETKLRSYSRLGPGFLLPTARFFFLFSVSNIVFVFFFVNSCLSRSYSFKFPQSKLIWAKPLSFFCCFSFFPPFHLLCAKFRFPVQFCGFICRIAYCFVFPKFRLCSHRVILKTI